MKIVFISNIFNHHQKSISDSLYKLTNGQYYFIATKILKDKLIKFGYTEYSNVPYVLNAYEAKEQICLDLINEAEIVIIGSADNKWIKERIRKKRIIFRYSERPLKNGNEIVKYLYRLVKWKFLNGNNPNFYLLCASAYSSLDYSRFFMYRNKMFKWGYFTETKHYDLKSLFDRKNRKEILWVGRFLKWKHPDDAIRVAYMLKKHGNEFVLNYIGCGEMKPIMEKMVNKYNLNNQVHFLGSMPQEKVREYMERSGILILTSDQKEGWGAVLNESMNSGCAVVASHKAGSVPYLINNGVNGFTYECENNYDLYNKVEFLLSNPSKQQELGSNAYRTIVDEWNAKIAAMRFIQLSEHIINHDKDLYIYKTGPCSKAQIIRDTSYSAKKCQ